MRLYSGLQKVVLAVVLSVAVAQTLPP